MAVRTEPGKAAEISFMKCCRRKEMKKKKIQGMTASLAAVKETSLNAATAAGLIRTGWHFHIKRRTRNETEHFPWALSQIANKSNRFRKCSLWRARLAGTVWVYKTKCRACSTLVIIELGRRWKSLSLTPPVALVSKRHRSGEEEAARLPAGLKLRSD